jgi:hypothetical protein
MIGKGEITAHHQGAALNLDNEAAGPGHGMAYRKRDDPEGRQVNPLPGDKGRKTRLPDPAQGGGDRSGVHGHLRQCFAKQGQAAGMVEMGVCHKYPGQFRAVIEESSW